MDGVIVDSNPFHEIALKKFCRKYGYPLNDEELKNQIFGRTNRDWLTRVFGPEITEDRLKQLETEKEKIFREIIKPHIFPVKGLIGFLETLTKNEIPIALATSAPPPNVDFTLKITGTESYFQLILDGSMIEKSKPDPEIYLKTIEQLRFPAELSVVFEDSLSGVEAARAAGCKVVGITTTHSRDELYMTDHNIDDFDDVGLADLERLFTG
ncbi:MAG: HAD family phosphatase [Calditrichaeota bacterium]|nr:HAD family phosphatase [Calditrichota bacterium]RQW03511.1 MAG: HAD family phosphatase [Calditrichota bacterium]